MCLKEIQLRAENMIIIRDSFMNITKEGLYDHVTTHVNMRFGIYIHMSSKNYEESGYNLDVDLLTISFQLCVSYAKRSELLGQTKTIKDSPTLHGVRSFVILRVELNWPQTFLRLEYLEIHPSWMSVLHIRHEFIAMNDRPKWPSSSK